MTLHKLTVGDGYTYPTRQVAAQDVTARSRDGLAAYYSEKGEAPGVWMGRGVGPHVITYRASLDVPQQTVVRVSRWLAAQRVLDGVVVGVLDRLRDFAWGDRPQC